MAYITVVRHGETPNNAANIVQSRTHGELTERGVSMAKCLGEHLKDEIFSDIYCSNLKRCQDTCANIVAQLKSKVPPINYTPTLQERDYGDWEFQSGSLVVAKRISMGLPPHHHHRVDVPNGESFEDCKKRAGKFFSEILKLIQDSQANENDKEPKNILVVSHGSLIACLVEYFMENPAIFEMLNFEENYMRKRADNTNRTRFYVSKGQDDRWRLTFSHFFDVEHLQKL